LQILVIDDEKLHAETVAEILERKGYRCTIATSGKDGAKKIDLHEYDLILTDLKMGDIDGLKTAERAANTIGDEDRVSLGHARYGFSDMYGLLDRDGCISH